MLQKQYEIGVQVTDTKEESELRITKHEQNQV